MEGAVGRNSLVLPPPLGSCSTADDSDNSEDDGGEASSANVPGEDSSEGDAGGDELSQLLESSPPLNVDDTGLAVGTGKCTIVSGDGGGIRKGEDASSG